MKKTVLRKYARLIAEKGGKKSVTLFFEDNEDLDQLLRRICGDAFVDEM